MKHESSTEEARARGPQEDQAESEGRLASCSHFALISYQFAAMQQNRDTMS